MNRVVITQSVEELSYGLDDRGFDSLQGLGIFLFTAVSRTALGSTQPPIQWVLGTLSLGVKRLGREVDHSLPSSAEVKNVWSYTSTPQYVFMAWCLVKHRDNLTFTSSNELFYGFFLLSCSRSLFTIILLQSIIWYYLTVHLEAKGKVVPMSNVHAIRFMGK
jgi:hypothetical protein